MLAIDTSLIMRYLVGDDPTCDWRAAGQSVDNPPGAFVRVQRPPRLRRFLARLIALKQRERRFGAANSEEAVRQCAWQGDPVGAPARRQAKLVGRCHSAWRWR